MLGSDIEFEAECEVCMSAGAWGIVWVVEYWVGEEELPAMVAQPPEGGRRRRSVSGVFRERGQLSYLVHMHSYGASSREPLSVRLLAPGITVLRSFEKTKIGYRLFMFLQ